jgi:hypothetical protein
MAAHVEASEAIPGLNEMVKDGPLTADTIPDVDKIGGKPYEKKDIDGIPITPQLANEVRSAEEKAGHDTGKGSVAARLQSAAAYNVRENIVPPVGTADIGTDRGVVGGKAQKMQTKQRVQQGAATHATNTL